MLYDVLLFEDPANITDPAMKDNNIVRRIKAKGGMFSRTCWRLCVLAITTISSRLSCLLVWCIIIKRCCFVAIAVVVRRESITPQMKSRRGRSRSFLSKFSIPDKVA